MAYTDDSVNPGGDDPRPNGRATNSDIMGSSAGAAERQRLRSLSAIASELAAVQGDDREAALERAAYETGRLIGNGADRSKVGDNLHVACKMNGLLAELGADAVQSVIAGGIAEGVRATEDEQRDEAGRASERSNGATPAGASWADPDWSIIEDRRGDLPAFPVDVLPEPWQPWLERAARGAGVMPDHVALPLLGSAAGLIGAARRVRASKSWSEPICLWTSVVGFSGTGKTPGLDVVRRPMSRIERSRSGSVEEQRAAYAKRAAAAKAALKKWRKEVDEAVANGKPPPDQPKDAGAPPPFVAPRFYVSDATIERVAVLIEARPRGMLMLVDELAGLFANMGRYSNGSDHEFWLEAWNGGHYSVERVGRPPISLPHLLVAMTGGFQPDKLARSFARADDGMYARHLFGWPTEPEYRPLTDDADEIDPSLQEALKRLIDLPAGDGLEIQPRSISLDSDAKAAFEAFRKESHAGKRALEGREREWWSKGPGQVLRLAGTLAYLAWAMPAPRPATKRGLELLMETARSAAEPETITAPIVESAVRLWRTYFWPHARAALRQMGGSDRHQQERRVLRWAQANGRTELSREEARRDALAQHLDAEGTDRVLEDLVRAGWLRAKAPEPTGGRSKRRWEVNPLLGKPRS
jgi:hypothetical protein